MTTATHINPEALHSSPAFSWAVRVPAGADTLYIGGQNGVGPDGTVVGPGMLEQARQAFANLRACLEAAGAEVTDIVKWTIFYVEGGDVHAGVAAFGEFWPRAAAPPRSPWSRCRTSDRPARWWRSRRWPRCGADRSSAVATPAQYASRVLRWCIATVLLVVGLVAAPAQAMPGDPPIVPLEPADGATLPVADVIPTRFTCPVYRQFDYGGGFVQFGGADKYNLWISRTPDVDAIGKLIGQVGDDGRSRPSPTAASPDCSPAWWRAPRICPAPITGRSRACASHVRAATRSVRCVASCCARRRS